MKVYIIMKAYFYQDADYDTHSIAFLIDVYTSPENAYAGAIELAATDAEEDDEEYEVVKDPERSVVKVMDNGVLIYRYSVEERQIIE